MSKSRGSRRPSAPATQIIGALLLLCVLAGPWAGRRLGLELPWLPGNGRPAAGEQGGEGTAGGRGPQDSAGEQAAPRHGSDAKPRRPSVASDDLPPGSLKSYGDVKVSAAGLRYGPGSEHGDRLTHVLRHAEDAAERNIHGVFDGGQQQIVALIDEAYRTAQRGGSGVRRQQDGGRTVYTVDLSRRIGYIGGQAGRRQNHPPATKLRLVLEDNNVITAYPVSR